MPESTWLQQDREAEFINDLTEERRNGRLDSMGAITEGRLNQQVRELKAELAKSVKALETLHEIVTGEIDERSGCDPAELAPWESAAEEAWAVIEKSNGMTDPQHESEFQQIVKAELSDAVKALEDLTETVQEQVDNAQLHINDRHVDGWRAEIAAGKAVIEKAKERG